MGNAVGVKLVFEDENEDNHDEHIPKVVKAGEPLMGTMIVETNKSISNARPYIFLIGKEKCKEKRILSTIFLQIQLPLAEIPNRILTPGRYEFPFLIDLPATIPRSFEFVCSPNSCKIKYYIEAQLRQGRKVRRYLFVDSAPTIPQDPVPFLGEPVTRDAALLSPRGTISFAGYVVDTRLGRGQTMEVCVAGRNDSNVQIKGIRIKMIETIIFSAHGAIIRTNITRPPGVPPASYEVVTLVQYPDVPPFEGMQKKSTLGVLKERREGFSPRQEHYSAIRNELLTKENVIRVKIPKYAKDTFRGRTLECRHHLEVQIVIASFGVTPLITIPLSIGNPQETTGPQTAIAVPSAPPAPPEEIDVPVEPSAPELFEQESNDYPVAVAVQLQPMDMRGISTRTPIAIAKSNAFIIGTHAVVDNDDDNDEEEDGDYDNTSLRETLLEVMPARIPRTPTFENLLQEMVCSVQDYDIILRKLADSAWMPIFSSLTPSQYGTIILHVNAAFDQPKVAALVASSFDNESHPFTCEFLLEALRNTEEWNRTVMVKNILPLCTDLGLGHNIIRNELNEWEQVVTLSSFEEALDAIR